MTFTPAQLAEIGSFEDAFKRAEDEHGQVTDMHGNRVTLSDAMAERPSRILETITGPELLAMEIPETRWAIHDLIGTGATLIAGTPKVGKSVLAFGWAVSVATGTPALGTLPVEQGPVLYLALDDSHRTLQTRLAQNIDTPATRDTDPDTGIFEATRGLHMSFHCPPLRATHGKPTADQAIIEWLADHPDARMVVIDIFAAIRSVRTQGSNIYEIDYGEAVKLNKLAHKHDIPILIVHHSRKARATDWIDQVSGTHGLTGGVDSVMVLERFRSEVDGILHVAGRDIDETDHPLVFDTERERWTIADVPVETVTMSETRAQILLHIRMCEPEPATPASIATALGMDRKLVNQTVRRMITDDLLVSGGRGKYYAKGN